MVTHPSILLVEDSPGECELFRLALAQTGLNVTLHTEQDADAAFRFLDHLTANVPGCSPGEVTGVVSTARIEGAHSDRAHSASTETMPVTSTSSLSLPEGGLNRSPSARVQRGESSTARCASTGDRSGLPSLILLDLNLCGQDGCDFLKRLRSDPRFATIPVVVLTTSDDPTDLARCYSCGANGYVIKPGTFDELVHCTGDLCRY